MRKGLWRGLAVGASAAVVLLAGSIGLVAHAMSAGGDTTPLQPGAVAPNFTLPSQTDTPVSLNDYKGKFVVLYFYPKDMTSGCTLEAHNFERDTAKYAAANAVVLGVSHDTVESHKTFCTKDGLNFKLLADPDDKVIEAYGVPTYPPTKIAQRYTFLISPDGKVLKVWEVKDIPNHSDQVLAAIADAKK